MSIQAITWAWEQDAASATDRLILIAIADFCDENYQCFPSQKKLAERALCSTDTVQRSLRRLEAAGLLYRQGRGRTFGGGGRTSDLITLAIEVSVTDKLSRSERHNHLNRKTGQVKPHRVRLTYRTVTLEPSVVSEVPGHGLDGSRLSTGGSSTKGSNRKVGGRFENGSIDTIDIVEVL